MLRQRLKLRQRERQLRKRDGDWRRASSHRGRAPRDLDARLERVARIRHANDVESDRRIVGARHHGAGEMNASSAIDVREVGGEQCAVAARADVIPFPTDRTADVVQAETVARLGVRGGREQRKREGTECGVHQATMPRDRARR